MLLGDPAGPRGGCSISTAACQVCSAQGGGAGTALPLWSPATTTLAPGWALAWAASEAVQVLKGPLGSSVQVQGMLL